MDLNIEILTKKHNKKNFSCGYEMLDNYIRRQAKQDIKRDLTACYVLNETGQKDILGYYTLSANSLTRDEFPDQLAKKLPPSYLNLPTILLGRLAIDSSYKGNGLGQLLLLNALERCIEISNSMGILAVIVDPIDETAERFYKKYGFLEIPGTAKMFIPIKTLKESIN